MKTIIRTILLGFFATICLPLLHSQSKVSFGYDSAGNRISRTIEFDPLRSSSNEEEEPPPVYSEMLSNIELKIYPNPTDGLLKVEILNLPEDQTADILLYDLAGKLITSHRKAGDFTEINISSQPAGIYLMKIVAGQTTSGGSQYQTEWRIIKR